MKRIIFAVVAMASMHVVLAQAIEFKGVPMGATVAEFIAVASSSGELSCEAEDKTGLKSCYGKTDVTYAEQQILSISADFLKDRLASVTIVTRGGTADLIRQAISSKYGVPTKRQLPQTNNNGTHYNAAMFEWKPKQGGRISIQDHPRPHNTVYVTLESAEKLAWFQKVNRATTAIKKDI